MKKFLLPIVAVSMCVASGYADEVYGTSPETAKPMPANGWFVPDVSAVPKEVWFTYKSNSTTPAMWGDAASDPSNPASSSQQVFVYLCDGGQQAFQMTEGSNSYVLFPGQEYLVKITPISNGFYCMNAALGLPPKFEGQKFYPFVIENLGAAQTMKPGETVWYQIDVPYATQIVIKDPMNPMGTLTTGIDKIETIHIECPGGTNTGNLVVGPYVKAGKNVIGLTPSESATEDIKFLFSYNSMITLNCSNNLLRGKSLTLDTENTYPDAYYTVDRYFTVPEDGTYTFTNHGAKGTLLNVGMVNITDAEKYKYECVWDGMKTATVGNSDAVVTVENLKAGETVLVQSDSFGVIGEGMSNLPYLKVTKGQSGVSEIAANENALKVNVSNGKLQVESVLLASGAEVAVYDMLANKVASVNAAEGAASLEMALDVNPGVYVVVVYGKGNSESVKIAVK